VDSPTEVAFLAAGVRQPQVLQVRVSPDIDFYEPSSVTADLNDQMLGFARTDGQAADAIRRALDQPLLYLVALHCHIGSQVTDASLYGEAIRQMVPLMAELRARHGAGHRWRTRCPVRVRRPGVGSRCSPDFIDDALDASCAAGRFPRPTIMVEPGRAMSARAGITLYRVLSVQSQPGGRAIVVVDGGLSDKPAGRAL